VALIPASNEETVAREYEAAREGAASFALDDRQVLGVSGPLRVKFLQGMLSNDVASRAPGAGCRAALMDAKGHLLAFLRVLLDEAEVVLEVAGARRDLVEKTLTHYRVAAPVRFAPHDTVVFGVCGPRAGDRLEGLGAGLPAAEPEAHRRTSLAGVEVRIARAGDLPSGGLALHVASAGADAVRKALADAGVVPLSAGALEALRVEDGRPWYGADISEKNLLHETGLVAEYHSPTKGCYVGQEVVARLTARGANVNQRLCRLALDAARPAGTALVAEGREVGRLTTAAVSPRSGAIALGYVHRAHATPGTPLDAAGARAAVAPLTPAAPSQ
jgi:folate-binding protein YgfZ